MLLVQRLLVQMLLVQRNPMLCRIRRLLQAAVVMPLVFGLALPAAAQQRPANPVGLDQDGTVHMPGLTVPVSGFLSPEGKAYMATHLNQLRNPAMLGQTNGVPNLLVGYLERERQLYPVTREDTSIGGVHAYVYTPANGIADKHRDKVLINLHGGGFSGCWAGCAELE